MTRRRTLRVMLLAGLLPAPLHAQLGELHFGAIGSYGAGAAYGGGAGLIASYSPGRLAYVGMRWIYYAGSEAERSDSTGSFEVTTRAQLFGADLGLEYPLGGMELVGGLTLGAMRFWQGTTPVASPEATAVSAVSMEFVVAPMVMLEIRAGPVMLIPQASYYFAGEPDFRWPVDHNGFAASLMVVIPIETDRIRY